MTNTTRAVYPLSADPFTRGHLDIIEKAAHLFGHVIVGVGNNPAKKYMLPAEVRQKLIQGGVEVIPNVTVEIFDGLLVDFAELQCATHIVRGVRNATDLEYELNAYDVNLFQNPNIETVTFFPDPTMGTISSSNVKALLAAGGDISHMVSPVVEMVLNLMSKAVLIGVTGAPGSGKSHVCNILKRYRNAQVISCDKVAHMILGSSTEPLYVQTRKSIVESFTELEDLQRADGSIDRKKLGPLIFKSHPARALLDSIMETPLRIAIRQKVAGMTGIVLLDAPLLVEMSMWTPCNMYIVVDAPIEDCIERIRDRSSMSSAAGVDPYHLLASQLSGGEKIDAIANRIDEHGVGFSVTIQNPNDTPDHEITRAYDALIEELTNGGVE